MACINMNYMLFIHVVMCINLSLCVVELQV